MYFSLLILGLQLHARCGAEILKYLIHFVAPGLSKNKVFNNMIEIRWNESKSNK